MPSGSYRLQEIKLGVNRKKWTVWKKAAQWPSNHPQDAGPLVGTGSQTSPGIKSKRKKARERDKKAQKKCKNKRKNTNFAKIKENKKYIVARKRRFVLYFCPAEPQIFRQAAVFNPSSTHAFPENPPQWHPCTKYWISEQWKRAISEQKVVVEEDVRNNFSQETGFQTNYSMRIFFGEWGTLGAEQEKILAQISSNACSNPLVVAIWCWRNQWGCDGTRCQNQEADKHPRQGLGWHRAGSQTLAKSPWQHIKNK